MQVAKLQICVATDAACVRPVKITVRLMARCTCTCWLDLSLLAALARARCSCGTAIVHCGCNNISPGTTAHPRPPPDTIKHPKKQNELFQSLLPCSMFQVCSLNRVSHAWGAASLQRLQSCWAPQPCIHPAVPCMLKKVETAHSRPILMHSRQQV